ncbi:MAG: glycosyltransferase family 4 protein [bacterium]
MKILITGDNGESLPPPYGGIIKRCLLHAKIWNTYGAQVFIHIRQKHEMEEDLEAGAQYFYDFLKTPDIIDKLWYVLKNFLVGPGVFIQALYSQLKLSREFIFARFLYCAGRAVYLDQNIKSIKPDIIITETAGLQSLVALKIAKRHKLPVILENYAELQYKDEAALWNYLVNGVDLVVPPSEHCTEGPRKYSINPDKIRIVYSGVNFDIFNGQMINDKRAARKEFNLPDDKFLVMSVGALTMRKGHEHIFEALLKLAPEKLKEMAIILCGMGSSEEMWKHAKEMNFPLDSLFIFQGLTEETLARLYSAMDCFCVTATTIRQCMGMAMKEAMSIGLPIVAYDVGGIKEAIENGKNGFLVPLGDRQAIADALEKTRHLSDEERKVFRENNIAKAKTLFDIKNTAALLYGEILKLLNQK